MTYDQAIYLFQQQNPGVDPGANNAFNNWSSQNFGAGGFESAAAPNSLTNNSTAGNTAANIFGGGDIGNQLQSAANMATSPGANSAQLMGGSQAGASASQGQTTTSGTQNQQGTQQGQTVNVGKTTNTGQTDSTGKTVGTTSGTMTGGTTGANTGVTNTQGQTTGTTNVLDTLGLGGLVKGQAASAQQADKVSGGFLEDLITNGPAQQQALTSQAVNNALSGPGMFGTGDAAKSRAAGMAAAQVGNQALNAQLQATNQMSGPTAVTTLSNAGTPYLGKTDTSANTGSQATSGTNTQNTNQATTGNTNQQSTNTGTQTGTQDTANAGQTLNLSDLVNSSNTTSNENQSGTSASTGVTTGSGVSPKTSTSSGGGCCMVVGLMSSIYLDSQITEAKAFEVMQHAKNFPDARGQVVAELGADAGRLWDEINLVRHVRDYGCSPTQRRGYYVFSERFAPTVQKSLVLRYAAYYTMVKPEVALGREMTTGKRANPFLRIVAKGWLRVFGRFATPTPFTRSNGEIV